MSHKNVVPTDPARMKSEAFDALETMPVTQLLDLIANSSTYPKDMRIHAARIAINRPELARKIALRIESDPDFGAIIQEITSTEN